MKKYLHTGRLIILTVLATFILCAVPHPAAAQRDANLEKLLENANLDGRAADDSPIPKSEVTDVNLDVHWQLWKRVVEKDKPGLDELQALEHDGRSIGWVNQITQAIAVSLTAGQHKSLKDAHEMFLASQRLAPDLPYPYFAHGSFAFRRDFMNFQRWMTAFMTGYETAWRWPDTRFPWSLKLLVFTFIALLCASFVFIVAQTVRQFGIVAYDLARVLPRGFSSNQTVVLLLAIVVVPGILLKSPLVVLVTLAATLSIAQRWNERIITAFVFILIGLGPNVDHLANQLASYSGSRSQALFKAQYVRCDAACLEDIKARQAENPDDPYILYTELLAAYRNGDRKALERIVEEVTSRQWPADVEAYAQNLGGASLLAIGKPDLAIQWLEQAIIGMPGAAAPAFNLMRAHQMKDDLDAASRALSQATSRNIADVATYLTYNRRDVNSFLMAPGLPLDVFWDYHLSVPREQLSIVTPYWEVIAGKQVDLSMAPNIALAGLLVVVLGGLLRVRGRMSTPCPRCGMARDPRDDKTTGAHDFCLPCYRTFVTGAGLDYNARIYNERVLGRRSRFQSAIRRLSSIIAPGAGHHLAGRSLAGYLYGVLFGLGLMLATMPLGIIRPVQELGSTNWGGSVTIGWALVSLVGCIAVASALRDIVPVSTGKRNQR